MRPGQRPSQRTVGGWRFRLRDVADAAGGHRVRGNVLRFGRASRYDGLAAGPTWTDPPYQGNGRPRKPRPRREERQTMAERSQALPAAAWREITIGQGTRGRVSIGSAPNGWLTRRRKPGEVLWAVYRRTWTAANPATICPTRGHPSGDPGLRGRLPLIETEFGQERCDSTHTRPALGRVGITTSPCACWPGPSY